ncbi:MAG: hypothetical protein FWG70_01910 [Oscillospiraceae bacterium]|nr:hypothetical protein [Oscillospiraceae bacterium]
MKKLTVTLILILLTMSLLSSCGGDTGNGDTGTPVENNAGTPNPTENNGETVSGTENEEITGDYVIDIYGVKFDFEKASRFLNPQGSQLAALSQEEDITAEEAFERSQSGERYAAVWDGVALIKKSSGEGVNSVDNPEAFDLEAYEVLVSLPENTNNTGKISDGDSLDGLTVKNSRITILAPGETARTDVWNYFELDGEITLSGYIVAAQEEAMYVGVGSIFFFPDPDSGLSFLTNPRNSMPFMFWQGDFFEYSDMMAFRLGTIYDEEYSGVDLRAIPDDGSALRVSVTLTDIVFSLGGGLFGDGLWARIVEIK